MALGYPHPRFLQEELTSQDITDWRAYELAEGFGSVRDDYRIGTLVALLYNIHRAKGAQERRWFDFFPNAGMPGGLPLMPGEEQEQETERAIEANNRKVVALFEAHNAVLAAAQRRRGAKG